MTTTDLTIRASFTSGRQSLSLGETPTGVLVDKCTLYSKMRWSRISKLWRFGLPIMTMRCFVGMRVSVFWNAIGDSSEATNSRGILTGAIGISPEAIRREQGRDLWIFRRRRVISLHR